MSSRDDGVPPDPAAQLRATHDATAAQLAAMIRDFDGVVAASADVATDDEHDPDGATIAFERAQLSMLIDTARARLADLEQALARVADGSYGRCEICGEVIPVERLEARPATARCVGCAGLRTNTHRPAPPP